MWPLRAAWDFSPCKPGGGCAAVAVENRRNCLFVDTNGYKTDNYGWTERRSSLIRGDMETGYPLHSLVDCYFLPLPLTVIVMVTFLSSLP